MVGSDGLCVINTGSLPDKAKYHLKQAGLSSLKVDLSTADWGSMVRDNATLITCGDITPLLPAGAIVLLTIGMNFMVDWFLHKTSGLKNEH